MRMLSSKARRKIQRLLPGSKHKSSETGATSGERPDSGSPLLRPGLVGGGHDGRDRTNAVWEQLSSMDLSRQDGPPSTLADRGEIDSEGRKEDIAGRGITQMDHRLPSDVEIAERSGPSREGNEVDEEQTRLSSPAVPHNLKPGSM